MATKIRVLGDHLWIGKAFLTGKDLIEINGQRLFEGKISPDSPAVVKTDAREYRVALRPLSKMMGTTLVDLAAYENGQQVLAQTFDSFGRQVTDPAEAKQSATTLIIAMICATSCAMIMVNLSRTYTALPGGFIGGAIAGGIGGFIGGMLGSGVAWILKKLRKST